MNRQMQQPRKSTVIPIFTYSKYFMTWVSMSIIIYSYYIYSPFQNGQKINLTYDIIYYINMSKNSSGVTLARTLKWLDKTEGRDKFCKAIQYACRYLKFKHQQNGNKNQAKKVAALFEAMKDARKLFRLFKSFKEYAKLLEVIGKKDMRLQDLILNVITRVGFLLYWLFDNLAILSKIKVINMDTKALGRRGSTFWFIALLSTFILSLKNIFINMGKINKATQLAISSKGTSSVNEGMSTAEALRSKNQKEILTLVKTAGDMLPAGQGCAFYPDYLGFSVNEGYCGLGGLVSALISSYDLYE